MYLQSHSLVGSWTLHSNFISMWNSTRNTGESLPRELKLKCTRDTPGFHIKQKPSIILRDHEMHLTHLHLQQWTQISHKMSEAFRGMGRSWHIIVLACGPKCIISIRKCREKGRERECWRMGTSKYLVSRKNFPRISTTQYTQLIPEDIQRVNSSIPVHLLLWAGQDCGANSLPRCPETSDPSPNHGSQRGPGPDDRSLRWPGSCDLEDLSAPLRDLGGGGRSVACGEVAWRDLCATRLATWLVGIHVDCQLSFPCSPRRLHVVKYMIVFCCPDRGKYY